MPIIPVFSSGEDDTVASDFTNLPYETLNINAGWTIPTVGGYTFNTATYDADGVGRYSFTGTPPSAFPVMPIAYRQAYALNASGLKTMLSSTDNFRLDIRVSNFQDTNNVLQKLRHTIGFGIANDPLSTNGFTFGSITLNVVKDKSHGIRAETGTPGSAGIYRGTDFRSQSGSIQVTDGKLIYVNAIALNGVGGYLANNHRNANTATVGYTLTSGPVYLVFFLLPFAPSAGTYSGEETQIKVEFRAIKYEDITP